MPFKIKISALAAGISFFVLLLCLSSIDARQQVKPELKPKIIKLDPKANEYVPLLGGPPETVTMHSGLVVLAPGTSVGIHNTEKYEEVLVILEGQGEMRVTGGPTMDLNVNSVAYCPPRTEHNVVNTGTTHLRYIYIVAVAENL